MPDRLHVTFTRDGRALVYCGEQQVGYATKGGEFHLWQVRNLSGEPIGKPSALLAQAVSSAEVQYEILS